MKEQKEVQRIRSDHRHEESITTKPKRKMKTMMKTDRNLNTIMKTILYLPLTALLITMAVAGPASAEEGAPFKGFVEGTEDFNFQVGDPSGIDLKISGSGGGNATHLGQFTATWDADITFANQVQPIVRTFVAANGDELWSEGLGAGTPPQDDPKFNQYVVEEHVIIGGTGRFEGARGSFTVDRVVYDVRPGFDLETFGFFDGTIILDDDDDDDDDDRSH